MTQVTRVGPSDPARPPPAPHDEHVELGEWGGPHRPAATRRHAQDDPSNAALIRAIASTSAGTTPRWARAVRSAAANTTDR
ncbi:hypothetical protein GA0070616_3890 [Micromonospora nigra]|uniref:Uncharacterized protein n=1 Tax=Micromonospora nigra TaxID=145857 RepID=A0A1C6SJ88_9ACTN|nr:hypothetical protein GA0070616_3890 [Micromonospora nigra]